jgi:hypothetical protein
LIHKKLLSDKKSFFHITKLCTSYQQGTPINPTVRLYGIRKPYNTLSDFQVSEILGSLVKLNTPNALELLVACATEALERRADKAFGVLTTESDRNQRIVNRLMDKPRTFHPLFGDEKVQKIANFLKCSRNNPKLAKWFWQYVYCTFTAEEKAKLELVNPVQRNGHRKDTIHQWLRRQRI